MIQYANITHFKTYYCFDSDLTHASKVSVFGDFSNDVVYGLGV